MQAANYMKYRLIFDHFTLLGVQVSDMAHGPHVLFV